MMISEELEGRIFRPGDSQSELFMALGVAHVNIVPNKNNMSTLLLRGGVLQVVATPAGVIKLFIMQTSPWPSSCTRPG